MDISHKKNIRTVRRLSKPSPRALGIIVKAALVVLILLIGYGISYWIKLSAPKVQMRPPEIAAPYVETEALAASSRNAQIEILGTVIPKTRVDLKAQVSGAVVAVNAEFLEGGVIPKDTVIVSLDSKDYELAIEEKKAELATARYNLSLEEGQQVVAKSEWELLKDSEAFKRVQTTDLALRRPHLEKARADLAAAQAALSRTELDLNRTRLTLPFNALVLAKNVDLGSYVNAQETVAAMVDIEAYYVQASVSVDRLPWLRFPQNDGENGSPAVIYYGNGHKLSGSLVKVLGDLDENGRMARVLIEVKNPLDMQNGAPLLLGEYVRVLLEGAVAENIIVISRNHLRDHDTIWLYNEGALDVVPVNVVWRARNEIFIKNENFAGKRIVTTNLSAPVQGMLLRLDQPSSQIADRLEDSTE